MNARYLHAKTQAFASKYKTSHAVYVTQGRVGSAHHAESLVYVQFRRSHIGKELGRAKREEISYLEPVKPGHQQQGAHIAKHISNDIPVHDISVHDISVHGISVHGISVQLVHCVPMLFHTSCVGHCNARVFAIRSFVAVLGCTNICLDMQQCI